MYWLGQKKRGQNHHRVTSLILRVDGTCLQDKSLFFYSGTSWDSLEWQCIQFFLCVILATEVVKGKVEFFFFLNRIQSNMHLDTYDCTHFFDLNTEADHYESYTLSLSLSFSQANQVQSLLVCFPGWNDHMVNICLACCQVWKKKNGCLNGYLFVFDANNLVA